tara:strand:+ start:571 stop:882 length:312 start_codon:yes stop_codon:yes gene_type:complete
MAVNIKISPKISAKLTAKHSVSEAEVWECFANVEGGFLVDDREDHQTDPATYWFVAETNHGRKLKVCFVPEAEGKRIKFVNLKTAFAASDKDVVVYRKKALAK